MPVRATKRGVERTALERRLRRPDLRCQLRGAGGRARARRHAAPTCCVDRSLRDRRASDQSACAAPTEWLQNLGLEASIRQTFGELARPHPAARTTAGRCRGPSRPSTTASCARCCRPRATLRFETAKVEGDTRLHRTPSTPTAATSARRSSSTRSAGAVCSATAARRPAAGRAPVARAGGPPRRQRPTTSSCGSTRGYVRAGYSWSFPAGDELRVGVGSFDPRYPRQGADRARWPTTSTCPPSASRATGSPTSCATPTEDGVFFAGDSAGHCLPTTAEGIRTALYFGLALRARAAARDRGPPDARGPSSHAPTEEGRQQPPSSAGKSATARGSDRARAVLP